MQATSTRPTAPALPAAEQVLLRRIAGMIIPASSTRDLPSADDDVIFADILASLGRDGPGVRKALAILAVADRDHGADSGAFMQALQAFRKEQPELAGVVSMVVAQCYYRDDRVMRAIGMEPRPPFPKGFNVPAGDLSLLAPVKARGSIYRRDR